MQVAVHWQALPLAVPLPVAVEKVHLRKHLWLVAALDLTSMQYGDDERYGGRSRDDDRYYGSAFRDDDRYGRDEVGSGGGSRDLVSRQPPSETLTISDMPYDISSDHITKGFAHYRGYVTHRLKTDREGQLRVFVEFDTIDSAAIARDSLCGMIRLRPYDTLSVVHFARPSRNSGGGASGSGKGARGNGGSISASGTSSAAAVSVAQNIAAPSKRLRITTAGHEDEQQQQQQQQQHHLMIPPPPQNPLLLLQSASSSRFLTATGNGIGIPPPPSAPIPTAAALRPSAPIPTAAAAAAAAVILPPPPTTPRYGGATQATSCLYIESGIPLGTSEREIAHIFRPFAGFVEVVTVLRGVGLVHTFVEFIHAADAATAKATLQGYIFDLRDPRTEMSLRIEFSQPIRRSEPLPLTSSSSSSHIKLVS